MKKLLLTLAILMVATVGFGAEISRQNIKPRADYKADGETFFMVNMTCAEENTELIQVRNNHFVKSNITNCILDGSNTFERSNYLPEIIIVEPEKTGDELRIEQLEKFITDNSLSVPAKELTP